MFEFQPGDLFACYGRDAASRIITIRTSFPWTPFRRRHAPSHVAVACPDESGRLLWIESTSLCKRPCEVNGRVFSGCQAHEPGNRILDYVRAGGRVELFRLAPVDRLQPDQVKEMRRYLLDEFVRRKVEYDMVGALLSGPALTARQAWTGMKRAFCSELLAGVLMHLNKLTRRNPGFYSPARLNRKVVSDTTYYRVEKFDPLLASGVIQQSGNEQILDFRRLWSPMPQGSRESKDQSREPEIRSPAAIGTGRRSQNDQFSKTEHSHAA